MNGRAAVWTAAAIVVAVVAYLGTHRARPDAPATMPTVAVATAREGEFAAQVDGFGHVGAPAGSTSALAFGVSGTIRSIDVRVGEHVAAGEPLARLDDASFVDAVAQAQGDARSAASNYGGGSVPAAALAGARERVRIAHDYLERLQQGDPAARGTRAAAVAGTTQADLKVEADRRALAREETLFAGGVAAQKDVDAARSALAADEADARALHARTGSSASDPGGVLGSARADYAAALADLRAAQARAGDLAGQAQRADAVLAQSQNDLARTVLASPVDGVVVRILKHVGETADPSTPVIEVGPGAAPLTTLYVSAADAKAIAPAQPVDLSIAGSTSVTHAKVSTVVRAIDPTTQQATVVVDGVPSGALPGDAVRGRITVARHRGILVPATAIVQDPQTGQTLVFVRRDDGGFDARAVVVAGSDNRVALIAGGLAIGESVAAHGAYELLAPAGGPGD